MDILEYGFEPDIRMAKDGDALVGLAVKSIQAMADSLSKRVRDRKIAGISPKEGSGDLVHALPQTPVAQGARVAQERSRVMIPVMSVDTEGEQPKVVTVTQQLRSCDTCYLSDLCPLFAEGSACGYEIPVSIQTPTQMDAACQFLLEMQFQRISFARFGEELEGHLQPRVGQEMDRFMKLLTSMKELASKPKAPEGGGALTRAFGNAVPPSPELGDGDRGLEESEEIFDAEEVGAEREPDDGLAYEGQGPGPSTYQEGSDQETGAFEDAAKL
jgi:hypothetical protein